MGVSSRCPSEYPFRYQGLVPFLDVGRNATASVPLRFVVPWRPRVLGTAMVQPTYAQRSDGMVVGRKVSNSNHSDKWHSESSRGNRLTRKLGGQAVSLARLERLLREAQRDKKGDKV